MTENGDGRALLRLRQSIQALLRRLIGWISEERYRATWCRDIEYELWEEALTGSTEDGRQAHFLADAAGGWIMWDAGRPRFVPMNVWLRMVEAHKKDRLGGGNV